MTPEKKKKIKKKEHSCAGAHKTVYREGILNCREQCLQLVFISE